MKKITIMSIITLLFVSLVGSVALANYGTDNSLYGQVKKNRTTKGINKAKVAVYTTGGTKKDSETTGSKGRYSFTGLDEAQYVVKASAKGYHSPRSKKNKTVSHTVNVNGRTKKNIYLSK